MQSSNGFVFVKKQFKRSEDINVEYIKTVATPWELTTYITISYEAG